MELDWSSVIDTINLLASVVAAITGVIAVWIAVTRRPKLQVADVRLLEVKDVDGLPEQIAEIEENWKAEEQQQELASSATNPELEPLFETPQESLTESMMKAYQKAHPDLYGGETYRGTLPNRVIEIKLVNRGKVAAYQVKGWLRADPARIELLDYFLDVDPDSRSTVDNGFLEVEVSAGDSAIHPTPKDDLTFCVAVKVHTPGVSRLEYEFAHGAGKPSSGEWLLKVPGSE